MNIWLLPTTVVPTLLVIPPQPALGIAKMEISEAKNRYNALNEDQQGEKSRDWIIELMLNHENELLKARSGWAFKQAISAVSAD